MKFALKKCMWRNISKPTFILSSLCKKNLRINVVKTNQYKEFCFLYFQNLKEDFSLFARNTLYLLKSPPIESKIEKKINRLFRRKYIPFHFFRMWHKKHRSVCKLAENTLYINTVRGFFNLHVIKKFRMQA